MVWLGELDGAARAAPSCARSAIAPETMVAPVAANTSGGGREGLREEEELGLAWHGGQSIAGSEFIKAGAWLTLEPPADEVGAALRFVLEHPADGAVGLAGQPDERVAVAVGGVVRRAVAPRPPDECADAPAHATRDGGLRAFPVWAERQGRRGRGRTRRAGS